MPIPDPATAAAALQNGEIDWLEVVLPSSRLFVPLIGRMLEDGHMIATLAESLLQHFYATRLPVKKLAVELPMRTFAFAVVTLKNRTVSPVAQQFIDCAREVSKPLSTRRPNPPGPWAGWKNRTAGATPAHGR